MTSDKYFTSKDLAMAIEQLAEQHFFNYNNIPIVNLKEKNAIDHPTFFHCWNTNLTWLLAHLKKGNKFIILSDVTKKENRYRAEVKKSEHFSAFAREISACIKVGYELSLEGENFVLTPSKNFDPKTCISNGELGIGINLSIEEVKNIFEKLEGVFQSNERFPHNKPKSEQTYLLRYRNRACLLESNPRLHVYINYSRVNSRIKSQIVLFLSWQYFSIR